MKRVFYFLYNILAKLYFNGNLVRLSNNRLFFRASKIDGKENNTQLINNRGSISIRIAGNGNKILIKNSNLHQLQILIQGNNNIVIIENARIISNTLINLKDQQNMVQINKNSGIGGARIVVAGLAHKILVGEDCMISDNVEIWASDTHDIIDNNTNSVINFDKDIIIKDHVWIGHNVIVAKGSIINENTVIGMGSLVTKELPGNSVCAGSPAKVIKENINWSIEKRSQ